MIRPTLIDLNPAELNYYPFMISLGKCNWSCNAVDELSKKICVPSKTKDENVKIFNMITRIYQAKTMVKHISCNFKYKFNLSAKNIIRAKRIIVEILAHGFVRIVDIEKVWLIIQ